MLQRVGSKTALSSICRGMANIERGCLLTARVLFLKALIQARKPSASLLS